MKKKIEKILLLLTKKNKIDILFIIFLSIIKAFIEIVGIGLLIPLLGFISSEQKKNEIIEFLPILREYSDKEVILIFIVVFLIIYLLKTIFVIFFNSYNAKHAQNLYVEIGNKLLKKYLDNNFLFFVQNNSAKLIRNIASEVNLLASGIIMNSISLLSNLILFFGVCVLLFSYNQYTVFVIFILLIVSIIVVRSNNKILMKWSEVRNVESARFIQKLNEVFGSIKEVILYNKSSFFSQQVYNSLRNFADSALYRDIYTAISSPLIEFVGILIIFIFYSYLNFILKIELSEIFVILGVFAFASVRLLPNLIAVVRSYQSIKFNYPAIDNVYSELGKGLNLNQKFKRIDEINRINFQNVSFKYPNTSKDVLKSVNFLFKKGDKIGITGETGSGKTTLINLISGLLKPAKGKIGINTINEIDFDKYKLNIGYVSQSVYLSDDSIYFNISLNENNSKKDRDRIKRLLGILNLNKFKKSSKLSIGERGSKISGGQIQRIGIARALFQKPSMLILDEATSALDENTERKILKYIFENFKESIIIFCTHKKKLLRYCNKVINVKSGRIKFLK